MYESLAIRNYETTEDLLLWQRADLLYPDLDFESRKRANRTLGKYALTNQFEINLEEDFNNNPNTLLSAIYSAAEGDLTSRELVRTNVATDYSERIYKSKNETVVEFDVVNDCLYQNGRKNTEIQENVFKYGELNEVMFARSAYEYKNVELFNLLIKQKVTDDFDVLIVSPTPTDEITRKKYNFFTDTDSMSMQLLSVEGDSAELNTAFVAGKKTKDGPRHDLDAIKQVALENGVDILDASEDDILQYVMLIPKGNLEHGVTSVVMQYDNAVGGTFYGEDEPKQDYVEFSKMCRDRKFDETVNKIVDKLIKSAPVLKTPQQAIELLDKLSGMEGVEEAVINKEINPAIFGYEAAEQIHLARIAFEQNHMSIFQKHLNEAKQVQKSSSCPYSNKNSQIDGINDLLGMDGEQSINSSVDEDKYGSLTFECPHCGKTNRRPKDRLIRFCQNSKCSKDVSC